MPHFSKSSLRKLETCDPELQTLFNYVIKYFDCKVIYGYRGEKAQNAAFDGGFSTVRWHYSKHNEEPSQAVDVIPWPIQWNNTDRMRYFIGFVKGVAQMLHDYGAMEAEITSGIDWDNDTVLSDQRFNDFPHFEIKKAINIQIR